ncbi:MAG: serine hydrolase, partial [Patescibacteria group bacterium]
ALLGLALAIAAVGLGSIPYPLDGITPHKKLRPAAVRPAPDYAPLKAQIQKFITSQAGMTYGIYFKDLTSGKSFGINDTWAFPAASCVKVPLVLYLNELVNNARLDWQDKVTYMSDLDYQGGAGALQFFARDGDKYSLRVLANLAITISDNIATRMLMRYLGKNNLIRYMRSMGAQTVYPNGENKSSPRDMALYVEAVINYAKKRPDGRRLLDDMANPIWHVGLPGKLPENITVAHKEGDLTGVADDIGVVYGSRPYILAVMSTGVPNEDVGFGNIATLSRMAYDYQEKIGWY